MTLMQDIFKMFARYPLKDGVLKAFNKGTSKVAGYDQFLLDIKALDDYSLIPAIQDFCFGVNEDVVKKRIDKFQSYYLFLDYGSIDSDVDGFNRRKDGLYLAVTVALPTNPVNYDMADEVLLTDQCLAYLLQIRDDLIKNQETHPWLKDLSDNHEISPFVARELNSSVGWTMTFKREGIGLL